MSKPMKTVLEDNGLCRLLTPEYCSFTINTLTGNLCIMRADRELFAVDIDETECIQSERAALVYGETPIRTPCGYWLNKKHTLKVEFCREYMLYNNGYVPTYKELRKALTHLRRKK